MKLTGFEDFSEKVLAFFKQAIERMYPDRLESEALSEQEQGIEYLHCQGTCSHWSMSFIDIQFAFSVIVILSGYE